MRKAYPILLFFTAIAVAQNTATVSGAWTNCSTWGSPPAIYRNTSDTKTINNNVTVTADANWSTAAIALGGSGAVAFNGGIFVDFANDQGADVACDIVYGGLAAAGCSSCTAYASAPANSYVMVTEAEYNAVRSALSSAALVGATDAQLNNGSQPLGPAATQAIAPSQPKAPASSYIVAFAANMTTAISSGTRTLKLKYNSTASATTGYADYGSAVSFNQTVSQKFFFVIKHPTQTTFSGGASYIAFYNSGGMQVENELENIPLQWLSDSNSLSTSSTYRACFQALTTTVKQW